MVNETEKRRNEFTRKPTDQSTQAAEGELERVQDNQRDAAKGNDPHSETGPAENLRAKAAKAEDKSEGSKEPA
jgi:hypothetical protein